jgi:hypothetical protein
MNPAVAYTAIGTMSVLAIIPWALIATGRLKTATVPRKGATASTAPRAGASGHQPREANGRFASKPEPLHEAGSEAA